MVKNNKMETIILKEEIKNIDSYKRTYLEIIKAHEREVIIANLLAYFFRPNEDHGLGDVFIRALLGTKYYELDTLKNPANNNTKGELKALLGKSVRIEEFRHAKVKVEESGNEDKKRLDILISTKSYAIGIEFKINHALNNPLKTYQDMISRRYSKEKMILIVLTPYKKILEGEVDYDESTEFKQVILSHFIKNLKDLLANSQYSMEVNQWFYLRDFIQTIENRSIRSKLSKLCDVAKTKMNNSTTVKYKECFINSKYGYVLFRYDKFDVKVRLKEECWHIERWEENKQKEFETLGSDSDYDMIIDKVGSM